MEDMVEVMEEDMEDMEEDMVEDTGADLSSKPTPRHIMILLFLHL